MEVVAIISGGIDSTVLLTWLKKVQNKQVCGMSFDYGQRHLKELDYAFWWANKYCKHYIRVELPLLKTLHSALTKKIAIPHTHYSDETQRATVVPNRNMIMLSFAIAQAEAMGVDFVYYAAHRNDRAIYPDCRKEFVDALSIASQLGTYSHVKVLAPFVNHTKAQIVQLGASLGVDFSRTWSCYEGGKKHCGLCGTCQERMEAFRQSGERDPTEYEERKCTK